jgi:hypothetical protein
MLKLTAKNLEFNLLGYEPCSLVQNCKQKLVTI